MRVKVLTPRGVRSILTYSDEDYNKNGEKHVMELNQTTIATTNALTEDDYLYKNGSLQGKIADLTNYTITNLHTLTTTDTFFGGEEIIIVPWK